MYDITQTVGDLLLFATIAIVGVEGIISLLDRFGFLPTRLQRAYLARDKRLIAMTLEESGLPSSKPIIQQVMDYWRAETLSANLNAQLVLEELICSTARRLDKEAGHYRVPLQYYIDLADYSTDWEQLHTLSQIMCSSIKATLASLDVRIKIDKIAAAPGNPALAVITAADRIRRMVQQEIQPAQTAFSK